MAAFIQRFCAVLGLNDSASSVKNDLQKLNERGGNNSIEMLKLFKDRIAPIQSLLGNSIWAIYEQVVVAALDCADLQTAKECVLKLRERFPDSRRVRRLICLYHECTLRWDLAERQYHHLIERDPADSVSRKRQICILRAKPTTSTDSSDNASASLEVEEKYASNPTIIAELVKYLEKFQNDQDVWGLLCDLYLIEGSHEQASFCMEELILCNSYNSVFFLKFAEILYSQASQKLIFLQQSGRSEKKGSELIEILQNSRAYYAHALRLEANSTRALFGFFLVASTLCDIFSGAFSQSQQSNAQSNVPSSRQASNEQLYAENSKYVEFARERLFVLYAAKCPGLKSTVKRALAQLQAENPASLLAPLAAAPSPKAGSSTSTSNNVTGSSATLHNGGPPTSSSSSTAADVSSSTRDRISTDSNANPLGDSTSKAADLAASLNASADTSTGKPGRGKKDKRKPHKS
jgi:hypothetical protein